MSQSNGRPGLLAVFARPQEESLLAGGTIAGAAAAGFRVVLALTSRGEHGLRGDPPVCSHDALPRVRADELRCACRLLGISRFEFLGYVDGRLDRAEPDVLAERLVRLIRTERPAVFLSPSVDSPDSDQRALAAAARLAFRFAGAEGSRRFRLDPAGRLEPHTPLRHLEALVTPAGESAAHMREQATTLVRLTEAQLDLKKRALHDCHRTQREGIPPLAWERFQRNFGEEAWYLAGAGGGSPAPLPDDVLSGIDI